MSLADFIFISLVFLNGWNSLLPPPFLPSSGLASPPTTLPWINQSRFLHRESFLSCLMPVCFIYAVPSSQTLFPSLLASFHSSLKDLRPYITLPTRRVEAEWLRCPLSMCDPTKFVTSCE